MSTQQFGEGSPFNACAQIAPGAGTGTVVLVDVAHGARRVDTLIAVSNDTVANVVDVLLQNGGTTNVIGSAALAAGAGLGNLAAVDLLAALKLGANNGIPLQSGDQLLVSVETAVSTGKIVSVTALGGAL